MIKIPQLLLAAGDSKRMGTSKPLLSWGKQTLIEHQINIRLQTRQDVFVVLGANALKITSFIDHLPVHIINNKDWEKGMGHSIAFGVKEVLKSIHNPDGILISVIDQPLIDLEHINSMLSAFQKKQQQIIASRAVDQWWGVPVLFDAYYFNDLQQISGEQGAKNILSKHKEDISFINAGQMLNDMDTFEEYEKLLSQYKE